MIDPKSVVTQVKQGNYPSDWRVYHKQHRKYGSACALWICAVVTGFICLASWSSGIVIGILFLCLVIVFVSMAIVLTREADSHPQSSILAILPTGVVQCDADDLENIWWLYFPNIDRIELAQETRIEGFDGDIGTETRYWLDIYCSDGRYLKWWINNCFGDTASIGKTIIAAYNYYWRQNSFFHL